jgi:hypothetical protein
LPPASPEPNSVEAPALAPVAKAESDRPSTEMAPAELETPGARFSMVGDGYSLKVV